MLLLPLLDHTPNTVNYMLAGYAVLLGLPILYVVSLVVRRRNLERDQAALESLERDEHPR